MDNHRAIVIGTGAGGLSSAVHLAKQGFEVVGLEQAENLGGWLAPFSRGGYTFSPGVHYVPGCDHHHAIGRILAELGIDPERLFCELDPDGFDVYRFGDDFEIRNCKGLGRYRSRLAAAFPDQASGLARFFAQVERVQRGMKALGNGQAHGLRLARLDGVRALPALLRWSSATYGELLSASIDDPRLRSVLAAASGDYGLPPSRASALVGVGLLLAYAGGAWFPRGGGGALRDALVRAAGAKGARLRTRARVTKILTREGRAVGVELADGERIDADVIVSDADPVITYELVDDPSVLPAKLREKVRRTESSLASFAVYLGMRRDLRAHGLGAANVWSYPDWDIEATYAAHDLYARRPAFFVSPTSLKDDSGAMAPAGCSALEVVTFVPYATFARWKDRPVGARGPEYEAEKKRVVDWLLTAVDERFPGLVGDVEVEEASTPLTNESYVMAVRGAAYGPAHTPEQMGRRRFGSTTPLPNLLLAGAGVTSCGVGPCLESGRVAATLAERAVARPRRIPLPRFAQRRTA